MHKQHRVDFVKQKLIFIVGLFSIGALKQINIGSVDIVLSDLLLFVPIVALAFDIYIFAEDFKIKRIGIFIFDRCKPSKEERRWEDWLSLPKHRERTALFASAMLTIVALVASLLVFHSLTDTEKTTSTSLLSNDPENIYWWFLLSSASMSLVFEATTYLRDELVLPQRNRLSAKGMYVGLFLILLGLAAIIIIGIRYDEYDWHKHPSYWTLISGVVLAAWLFALQRVRREIAWRGRGRFSLVKFTLRPKLDKAIQEVYLCGDFTKWSVNKVMMTNLGNGSFTCTVALEAGKSYEYKYLTIDTDNMEYWVNVEGEGEEKSIFNEGWNENAVLSVEYTRFDALVGSSKFLRDIYS